MILDGKEGWQRFLNTRVSIFYDDNSPQGVSRKDGLLISNDVDSIVLLSYNLQILIPKSKIIRLEVQK